MKKNVFTAIVFSIFCFKPLANAQHIGLKWQNVKPKTAVSPKLSSASPSGLQLFLPKSNDALVRIQQNRFYSQSRYPQAYLHRGNTDFYTLNDRYLQNTASQKELFFDRFIETAIVKLFKLD